MLEGDPGAYTRAGGHHRAGRLRGLQRAIAVAIDAAAQTLYGIATGGKVIHCTSSAPAAGRETRITLIVSLIDRARLIEPGPNQTEPKPNLALSEQQQGQALGPISAVGQDLSRLPSDAAERVRQLLWVIAALPPGKEAPIWPAGRHLDGGNDINAVAAWNRAPSIKLQRKLHINRTGAVPANYSTEPCGV